MNDCSTIQKKCLLQQTGEVSAADRADVATHLGDCGDCRAWAAELDSLPQRVTALPAGQPGPGVVTRLVANAPRPQRRFIGMPLWAPLAGAAALALIVAGSFSPLQAPTPPLRAQGLHTLAIMVAEDIGSTVDDLALAESEDEEALRALAQQLLMMEGLGEDEGFDLNLIAPASEPSPTTFRSRSSDGQLPRTHV